MSKSNSAMRAGKKACMICGKEKNGTEIEEDYIIHAMRWFKQNVSKNAKNYRIVVCKECMPEYGKVRSKFVRKRAMYVGLGIVFTIALAAVSGGKYLGIVFYGVAITLFLYALSLISYVPDLRRSDRPSPPPKSRR